MKVACAVQVRRLTSPASAKLQARCVKLLRAAHPADSPPSSAPAPLGTTDLVWLAEADTRLIGLLVGRAGVDTVDLTDLIVTPTWRRQRVGSVLLAALCAWARKADMQAVLLEVRVSNDSGRAFYLQHGFYQVGRRVGYYAEPPEDALILRLDLGFASPATPVSSA